jgi:hypothetical protein
MQIHELTKLATNEGILDGLKAAVNVAKTGYNQGKAGGGGKLAGLKGLGKALTSPQALATAQRDVTKQNTVKRLDKLDQTRASQGLGKVSRPLNYYIDQVKQDPQAKQERQQLDQKFDQTFELGPVLPDPGQVLKVTHNNADYYKDEKGQWYQEPAVPNQPPRPIPAGTGTQPLEALIDQDQYSQTSPPAGLTKQVTPVAPTKPTAAAPVASPAAQPATTMAEARPVAAPGSLAKRAATRSVAPTPAAPTPVASNKPKRNSGKKKLRTEFNNWIAQVMPEIKSITADSEAQSRLNKQFTVMANAKNDPSSATKAFDDYLIIAQACIARSKDRPDTATDNAQTNPASNDITQLRGRTFNKTGTPELDQMLQKAGINLRESQVAITKDIHVKTAKGDYVKRASDQQWYDPNGILIDADKYPEFVAKLDKTDAARTRYQSDSVNGAGSDTSFVKSIKQKLAPSSKKSTSDPAAPNQQYDLERLRMDRNMAQNDLIDKTVNNLRNAEIFGTGQEEYLRQQLAQLMAKKY